MQGKKINKETTHEFFKRKPPTIFNTFQFHIRRTQQNHHFPLNSHWTTQQNHHFPLNSHWTITTALPRINHIQRYEKNITHDDYQLSTKPIERKRPEIMKMMVSRNRTEGDFEEETLFGDIVCFILYLIVGVL